MIFLPGRSSKSRRSNSDSPLMQVCCKQDDLERVKIAGNGQVDITVGSALDIFGGKLPFAEVLAWHRHQEQAHILAH